jgi:hypothetical protein
MACVSAALGTGADEYDGASRSSLVTPVLGVTLGRPAVMSPAPLAAALPA